MDIFDFPIQFIPGLTSVIAWMVIGFFAYRIYKKQAVKPRLWKVIVIIFVGLFSFSLDWSLVDTAIKIPILPLGVWILYWFFKRKEDVWQTYRAFALLGFFANFLFLAAALLAIPIQNAVYPVHKPSTFIVNVENASIINIHPSAKNQLLSKNSLLKQIHNLKRETIYSEEWYGEMTGPNKINERFPYQLVDFTSKWGSGLSTIVYIEDDGKGILVLTPIKQYYFRSQDSLLEKGK